MGSKVSLENELTTQKLVCYYPLNSNIKWAYSENFNIYDLDVLTKSSCISSWLPINIKTPIDIYFLEDEGTYKTRSLYTIQSDEMVVKPIENADDENLSDVFLIDIESKKSRIDNIYIFDIHGTNLMYFKNLSGIKLRDYIRNIFGINIPEKYNKVFFRNVSHNILDEKDVVLSDDINENLGITLEDIVPQEYPFYFLHSTKDPENVIRNGKLCNYGQCNLESFDETTGKYLYPKLEMAKKWGIAPNPGIYMEYIDIDDILFQALVSNDLFRVKDISTRSFLYGETGFIFPIEEVFKYHVNIKDSQNFGHGKEVDLNDYYHLEGPSEIIVRANTLDISKASAIHVQFSSIELRFIYDYIPNSLGIRRQDIKIDNVINLYKEHANNRWYIRKSNLIKMINAYESNGLKIPPILCTKIREDITSEIYGTIYDTDSDAEEYLKQ